MHKNQAETGDVYRNRPQHRHFHNERLSWLGYHVERGEVPWMTERGRFTFFGIHFLSLLITAITGAYLVYSHVNYRLHSWINIIVFTAAMGIAFETLVRLRRRAWSSLESPGAVRQFGLRAALISSVLAGFLILNVCALIREPNSSFRFTLIILSAIAIVANFTLERWRRTRLIAAERSRELLQSTIAPPKEPH
jgi:hypothetical protein